MSALIVPEPLVVPDLVARGVTDAGREHPLGRHILELDAFQKRVRAEGGIGGGASFSDYLENALLDHIFNDPALTAPATVALALTTVVPDDAKTGATITEAAYTGYLRKVIATSDMSAAATGSKTNSAAITFAACTGSSSTIIGWATLDSSSTGAGNMLVWGTCTSTVISTTQTPATVAIGALVVNLD